MAQPMEHYRTTHPSRWGAGVLDGRCAIECAADRALVSGTFRVERDMGIYATPESEPSSSIQAPYRATSQRRATALPGPSESIPAGFAPHSMVGNPIRARKNGNALLASSENGRTEISRPVDAFNTAAQNASRARTQTVPATLPATLGAVEPRTRKKNWRPHCRHQSCLRPASYAYSDEDVPVFCEKHKIDGMENIVHPNRGDCIHMGCARVSSYAATGDTLARFCHLHKEKGMVKVRDRIGTRCEEVTCLKQASFAMEYERYPRFCKEHKQEDMVNIRNHRCLAPGCSRGASFAVVGGRQGVYCSEHKLPDMVNTRRRPQCLAPGCSSRKPVFVLRGQQLPKFCSEHGGVGMVDIREPIRTQRVLPDRARQLGKAAVAVAAVGKTPLFSRDTDTPATQPHLHPNIDVRQNVAKSTRTSPPLSSSSSFAPKISASGQFERADVQGRLSPGPICKRRRAATYPTYPMYSKPSPAKQQLGAEPDPPNTPPRTPPWHRMSETERSTKMVGASDGQIPPAGIQALEADTHSDSGAVDHRPRGFSPTASPIDERNVTSVVKVGGKGCGGRPVHPLDQTSGRFAIGTAVRAGKEANADPPLSAVESSHEEVDERARSDLPSPPPYLESSMARTTGVRLRFRVPYASSFTDTQSAFSSTQHDTRQATPTNGAVIDAYDGPPGGRDLGRPLLKPTNVMPVKNKIGPCHEMPAFKSGAATTEHKVADVASSGKIPKSSIPYERDSGKIPVRESGVFAKRCYLEHGQPSGYSRTSFYLNLVKALTKKLEARGSSSH